MSSIIFFWNHDVFSSFLFGCLEKFIFFIKNYSWYIVRPIVIEIRVSCHCLWGNDHSWSVIVSWGASVMVIFGIRTWPSQMLFVELGSSILLVDFFGIPSWLLLLGCERALSAPSITLVLSLTLNLVSFPLNWKTSLFERILLVFIDFGRLACWEAALWPLHIICLIIVVLSLIILNEEASWRLLSGGKLLICILTLSCHTCRVNTHIFSFFAVFSDLLSNSCISLTAVILCRTIQKRCYPLTLREYAICGILKLRNPRRRAHRSLVNNTWIYGVTKVRSIIAWLSLKSSTLCLILLMITVSSFSWFWSWGFLYLFYFPSCIEGLVVCRIYSRREKEKWIRSTFISNIPILSSWTLFFIKLLLVSDTYWLSLQLDILGTTLEKLSYDMWFITISGTRGHRFI